MQMSPKTPHKALQTEAASSSLNSTLFPVHRSPGRGKGSARIFSHWLEEGGGRQSLRPQGLAGPPWFNSLGLRLQLLSFKDRPEGAVALGTPHLGPGGDSGGTRAVGGVPRSLGSFQVHKSLARVMITVARKGELPPYRNKVGSHFCKNQE